MKLNELTIKKIKQGLENKEFSCEELTKNFLRWIKQRNKDLNAVVDLHEDEALTKAKQIDLEIQEKNKVEYLQGVPCLIKDNILVKGKLACAGSKILSNYKASYNATVVEKLNQKGCVILGKTNMDEFAMGGSGETSFFGPTKNPRDLSRVPGGSSSGSACAVADNQCVFALGSDTGGSIRQPASFTGSVGLKPTYGAVSRYGLMAMASSFDQIGSLTQNVEDAAVVFDAIRGQDKFDATSIENKNEVIESLKNKINGKVIGLPKEYFIKGMDEKIMDAVLRAVNSLRDLGAQVEQISLPNTKYALATYYVLMPAEVSSNLARYDGVRYGFCAPAQNLSETYLKTRYLGFGDEVKRRIMLGTYVLSAGYQDQYYKKAQKYRGLIKQDFDHAFDSVDYIITPTTPSVAFGLNEKFNDPVTMYLADIFTVSANVAGLPAISVPCGSKENLPIGLQILGKPFAESSILNLAYQLQENLK